MLSVFLTFSDMTFRIVGKDPENWMRGGGGGKLVRRPDSPFGSLDRRVMPENGNEKARSPGAHQK